MLRFPLLGIPVGIHLSFLLIALFGLGVYQGAELVAWTVGVGVAVLFHEAGHAFTARAFGATLITITLFALGGFTTWAPGERSIGPGRRFLIAASGSAVGIAVGGSVLFAFRSGLLDAPDGFARVLIESFILAALVWGIFNWLPMLPLDGGHMAQSALEIFLPSGPALAITKGLTLVSGAGAAAVLAFVLDAPFGALWIALIAIVGMRTGGDRTAAPEEEDESAGVEGRMERVEEVEDAERPDPPPFPI